MYLFLHLHILEMSRQSWPDSNAIYNKHYGGSTPISKTKRTQKEKTREVCTTE